MVAQELSDIEPALACYEECLTLLREMEHKPGTAGMLSNLGALAELRGEYARATALFDKSLTLKRELSDRRGIASSLNGLALVAVDQGETVRAAALVEEGLGIYRALEDGAGVAACLLRLAIVVAAQHAPDRAARLLGAAEALAAASGYALRSADRAHHNRTLAAVRSGLAEEAFAAAWAAGQAMTENQAVAYALEEGSGRSVVVDDKHAPRTGRAATRMAEPVRVHPDRLTAREVEVLRLLAHGQSNRQIAEELVVSVYTVARHLVNIYAKIGARGRADATAYALRHNLA
jgi:non-specific serine/threonine protein kinase